MKPVQDGLSVGVFGANGAVGSEIIHLLEHRAWKIENLSLYGGARSAGKSVRWRDQMIEIRPASTYAEENFDLALLAANSDVAREVAPVLASRGTYVIDNSSAFRMSENVPLVIPEINFDAIGELDRIIANPNCCTIIMLMAVAPLRSLGSIKRIIVSTYQSASGAGREAMEELEESTQAFLNGEAYVPQVLPYPYAFNLFSHNTTVEESGYNGEEMKMILETRKILGDPGLLINPTCIRVPVLRSHSESITVEFAKTAPSVEDARACLSEFPGITLIDDREANRFPMPNDSNGQSDVFVGRIRGDISNPKALSFFVCGDQLLKGAALNAVQIGARLFGINFV
ncbi:MAG: aspartate-semialdehyde dehydrogenase [Fimbriimonadaceae bacterium]